MPCLGPCSPAAGATPGQGSCCRAPLSQCWWSSHPAAPCWGQAFLGTGHPHGTLEATTVPGRGCGRQAVDARGHQAALPRTSTLMRKTMRKKTHMKKRSITLATFFHSLVRRWAARWRRKQPVM